MGKIVPDPRNLLPSKADPEHRSLRKELEKNHGLGYKEPLLLGLLAMGLVWNMETQVKKCEEKKERKEREARERDGGRGGARDRGGSDDGRDGGDDDDRRSRRARSSRRAPPPPGSTSGRRGGGMDERYDNHEAARRGHGDYYHRGEPARWSQGYGDDHYYYDYPRSGDRDHGRRDRYYVDDIDGVPRTERRHRAGGGGGGAEDDGRSEFTDGASAMRGSQHGSAARSHYSGSQRLDDQYDDGFEKKRFDSTPVDPPPVDERRSRRSRRDSW